VATFVSATALPRLPRVLWHIRNDECSAAAERVCRESGQGHRFPRMQLAHAHTKRQSGRTVSRRETNWFST